MNKYKRPQKVGIAFSDFVEERNYGVSKNRKKTTYSSSPIFLIIPLVVLLGVFVVLFFRLFYVQIVQGAYYKQLANDNRTRTVTIPASRGIIFDRYNRPLVRNVPIFEVTEKDAKGKEKVKIVDKDEALNMIHEGKNVTQNVSREYLYNDAFAHVLGYTGHISDEELGSADYAGYTITDLVGKMGLEKEYEKILHGQNGKELYEVNAQGKQIRFLGREEEVPGKNIKTTLDLDVQQAAENAMRDIQKGAVVVSDPRNGDILAIYSKPTFDSNMFTHGDSYQPVGEYQKVEDILLDQDNQPLLDRAIGGAYPPGSTFKLVTATAGLTTGKIKPDTIIEDTGNIKIGGITFGSWYFIQYGRREGPLDVVKAIKRSNDIFFYKVSQEVGADTLSSFAEKFGLGKKLGIDLQGEVAGTVPTEEWKKRVVGENWYLGDTFNYGIGQGYLLATPLQVNSFTQPFANGGKLFKPHLIKEQDTLLASNLVSPEYSKLIREGMQESCATGGVAFPFFNFTVQNDNLKLDGLDFTQGSASQSAKVASPSAEQKNDKYVRVNVGCKTGTAEIGDAHTKPHAWITVIAPFHNPEVVVTVLVENGGEGSSVAGPIARDILKEYFEKKN